MRIDGWPRLGAVDVAIRASRAERYDIGIELKWIRGAGKVDEVVWDAYKLAALASAGRVWAGYVIVASR